MKYFILFLIFYTFALASFASESNHCFKAIDTHIREAILHNKKLTPVYSKLSDGKSVKLSRTLIFLEEMSVLFSINIERQSNPYREMGIPLLCEEIVDMKELAPFRERLPVDERPDKFYNYDQAAIRLKIKKLMEKDQFEEAYSAIAEDLYQLEDHPNQLCLTRHFLESIARTIQLSFNHREKAKKLGMPDPKHIIKKFISMQRRALYLTYLLDKQAFPLQKDGLLIYCQDVPFIPWK